MIKLSVGCFICRGFVGLVLMIFITLTSCSSLKSIEPSVNINPLSDSTLIQLNGSYRVFTVDTQYRTLSYAFFLDRDYTPSFNDRIHIQMIDNKHIQISLYSGKKLRDRIVKRGRLKDGYFFISRFFDLPFVYLVLNSYSEQKTRITVMKNGNLSLDTTGGGCAFLVLFPIMCADDSNYNLEYQRID